MSVRIFAVEDDALTGALLRQYVGELGYEFAGKADNGEAALEEIRRTRPDLVLMDIRLHGAMDGVGLAARLRDDNATGVLFLSAYADEDVLARAKLTEPYGYLVKPFNRQGLQAAIEVALYKRDAELRQLRLFEDMVRIVTELVKLHDVFLNDVQARAAALAAAIAAELGLPRGEVRGIGLAAKLHAIGLVAMPAELLLGRTPLQGAKKAHLQSHPETAWGLLKDIAFPWPVAEMVRQHMERMDGSGFPRGLSGEAILPGARILAVACMMAKMLTAHGGKAPASVEDALNELGQGRGTLFEAGVVDACERLFREKGYVLSQ